MLKSKTTALLAAVFVIGIIAAPAGASSPPPSTEAVATCQGIAEVDPGLHFPDPLDLLPGPEFEWKLETDCEVVFVTTGGPVEATAELNVSGKANGWCGLSEATEGEGTLAEVDDEWSVDVKNVTWNSAGSVLVVQFDLEDKDNNVANGYAEVQASPQPDATACDSEDGAEEFLVTIVAETEGVS